MLSLTWSPYMLAESEFVLSFYLSVELKDFKPKQASYVLDSILMQ